MAGRRWRGLGMWGLALGYFAWYVPYSALTKALSSGASCRASGERPVYAQCALRTRELVRQRFGELNGALYSGSGGA